MTEVRTRQPRRRSFICNYLSLSLALSLVAFFLARSWFFPSTPLHHPIDIGSDLDTAITTEMQGKKHVGYFVSQTLLCFEDTTADVRRSTGRVPSSQLATNQQGYLRPQVSPAEDPAAAPHPHQLCVRQREQGHWRGPPQRQVGRRRGELNLCCAVGAQHCLCWCDRTARPASPAGTVANGVRR